MAATYNDLDMGPPIRDALMGNADITAQLAQWRGEPSIFTRRPVPADTDFPLILINQPRRIGDADGLNSDRPIWEGDIGIYGRKAAPNASPDHTRAVNEIGYLMREQFHRQRFSVQPEGFSVIDVRASGPVPAPTDDEETVGRIVSLIIRLRRTS